MDNKDKVHFFYFKHYFTYIKKKKIYPALANIDWLLYKFLWMNHTYYTTIEMFENKYINTDVSFELRPALLSEPLL